MIYAYSGVSSQAINEPHTTTDGKPYTMNHNPKLVAPTDYLGKGAGKANSQGWERDRNKFFTSLEQKNPELFSRANQARIKAKQAPRVDDRMVKHAPELKPYKGEELVHHHIGGDGQAVAAPQSVHPGSGGIHNVEKKAGITQKCEAFSDKCEKLAQKNPQMRGRSVDEFHAQVSRQSASQSRTDRTDTVRNQTAAAKPSGQDRASAVRSQAQGGNTAAAQARANAVRSQPSAAKAVVKAGTGQKK